MRNVLTVAGRELAAYFATPVASVFIVIFLILQGTLTFNLGNFFDRGQADLAPFFTFIPWVFLLLANGFLLFVGCFMETIAAITILVPVFMPILAKLGIDPVHFGLILVLNLMIGLATPPVGVCLFICASIGRISLWEITVAVWPFLLSNFVVLGLVTAIPAISLWLPSLFYR